MPHWQGNERSPHRRSSPKTAKPYVGSEPWPDCEANPYPPLTNSPMRAIWWQEWLKHRAAQYKSESFLTSEMGTDRTMSETSTVRSEREATYDILSRSLKKGLPFFWERESIQLALAASKKLGADVTLSGDDLLCRSGFFYFETPFQVEAVSESTREALRAKGVTPIPTRELGRGIAFTTSHDEKHDVTLLEVVRLADIENDSGIDAPLFPVTHMVFPLGCRAGVIARAFELRDAGIDFDEGEEIQKLTIAAKNAQFAYDDVFFRFTMAALLFVNQKILTVSNHHPSRRQRRRAAHEGRDISSQQVRVVRLRARSSAAAASKGGSIDWACRWAVSGHWRNQFYPNEDRHKTIWIDPYVKGPEDKPFRQSVTVYDVNR